MKQAKIRLISLNLAILLLISLSMHCCAISYETDSSRVSADAPIACEAPCASDDSDIDPFAQRKLLRFEEKLELEIPQLSVMTLSLSDAYPITVNGTRFYSDETKSGKGWRYEDGELMLDGYNGSSILASGDLVIYSSGTVTIKGKSGTYGGDGICVSGFLDLNVDSGTLTVTGGTGTKWGGTGVYAESLYCYLYGGTAKFSGGSGGSSATLGGDAIWASDVSIYGSKGEGTVLTAIGGSTRASGSVAGCGIYAEDIYLSADSKIQGANGNTGAPAVYYQSSCEFGPANISLKGGKNSSGKYQYPIQRSSSADSNWYKSRHTTDTYTETSIEITINKYSLLLCGNGGKRGSATSTSLYDYYPTYYDLSDYTFTLSGYEQVAWTDASGDLVPLNALYRPTENTWLDAEWARAVNGDILLLGLDGMFTNDLYWRRYSGYSSATLPGSLRYNGSSSSNLLGWSSVAYPQKNEDSVMSSTWYAPYSTVQRNVNAALKLYAQRQYAGNYVVYHGEDAEPLAGGNIVVQSVSTWSNLSTYAVDAEAYFAKPEDFNFVGWAKQQDADAAYSPGTKLPVVEGTPLHLYAKWEPQGTKYSGSDIHVWYDKGSNTLALQTTQTWQSQLENPKQLFVAFYDAKNKMTLCRKYDPDELFVVEYTWNTLPRIKVFALNAQYGPAGRRAQLNLSGITP